MTPDIDIYAPFVQAVFGVPERDETRIPFSIADRRAATESPFFQSFLAVLELPKGRFTSEEVLHLLECEAIRYKFQFTEQDITTVRRWASESGIRWGRDTEQRSEMGLPLYPEHTWRFGLDRLLLGYGMPGSDAGRIFKDILPFDRVEGTDAGVLGCFVTFLEKLMSHVADLGNPQTVQMWVETFQKILHDLFSDEGAWGKDAQMIRRSLTDLAEQVEISGYSGSVSLDVVKSGFLRQLVNRLSGSGFLTDGVTFCSMLPMRSIPFKVICIVGMNCDAYPRQSRRLGFDLMAQDPRRGDRSRRSDDRYLFLEALLSARERFYISFVGQSAEDNSPSPPSTLVSELMDYLEENFEFPGIATEDVQERLVIKHRLQAFSPVYFKGGEKYFSYSQENLDGSVQKLSPSTLPSLFLSKGISPPEDAWRTLTPDRFTAFFSNPARFLLRERLGITLGLGDRSLEEKEPFELTGLEKYSAEQLLLKELLSGGNPDQLFHKFKAEGRMPHGMAGQCAFERIVHGVAPFAAEVRERIGDGPVQPREVDIALNGLRIKGPISGVCPSGLIQFRYATAKAKDHLSIWIKHLFIHGTEGAEAKTTSTLLASDGCWVYPPVDSPGDYLEVLGKCYLQGLEKPLVFFPDTSLAYAKARLMQKKKESDALEKASDRWIGNPYRPHSGESEDDYFQLCFGGVNPFDETFRTLALDIYGPLLSAWKKIG